MDQLSVNPFVYKPKFERRDILIMVLMIPVALLKLAVLLPLFALLFFSSFFFYTIKQIVRPVNYHEVKKYYITIPMFFMKSIFFVFGIRIRSTTFYDKKNIKANLYIFAPHSSMFDIAVLFSLGVTTAVARDETKNVWILSKFILLLDPILVKRDNPQSRQETIRQIKIRANYEKIAIFPEGTCTNRGSIIKFRLGAFTPGLPVQTVYIDYEKNTENNTIWAHEGLSAIHLVTLTLLKWETPIRVHLPPVYSPVTEEIEEPWQFGTNVQNYFCEYFNLQKSLYSFEDPRFLSITKQKGIPRSPTCLKLVKICFKVISLTSQEKISRQTTEQRQRVYETSSSQMIALKNKKSSIGSINSMIDFNSNWIEELDSFMRNFVSFCLDKLNGISELSLEINSVASLINFLEFDKKYPGIEQSSTIEDFFNTISGLSNRPKMTYLDLYIVLSLCNLSTICLRDRIDNCIMKMENVRRSQLNEHAIIYPNFCKLIWHLLGIDESYLVESIFRRKKINSDFFRKEIVQYFPKAVFENAPDLALIN